MNIWVFVAFVIACGLIVRYIPKIIPTCVAIASFAFSLYLAYEFFGIWGAVIVGVITVTAVVYLSRKALAFLEKYDVQVKRKK